jgi:hypothetical protein
MDLLPESYVPGLSSPSILSSLDENELWLISVHLSYNPSKTCNAHTTAASPEDHLNGTFGADERLSTLCDGIISYTAGIDNGVKRYAGSRLRSTPCDSTSTGAQNSCKSRKGGLRRTTTSKKVDCISTLCLPASHRTRTCAPQP